MSAKTASDFEIVEALRGERFESCAHLMVEFYRRKWGVDLPEPKATERGRQRQFSFALPRAPGEVITDWREAQDGDVAMFRSVYVRHAALLFWRGGLLYAMHAHGAGGGPVFWERFDAMCKRMKFLQIVRPDQSRAHEVLEADGIETLFIIAVGIFVVGTAVAKLLAPPLPSFGDSAERETADNFSLSGAGNRLRLNQPMQLVLGKHLQTPDLAAQPYNKFNDDGDDTQTLMLHAGVGDARACDLHIGDTPQANFGGVEYANEAGELLAGCKLNLAFSKEAAPPVGKTETFYVPAGVFLLTLYWLYGGGNTRVLRNGAAIFEGNLAGVAAGHSFAVVAGDAIGIVNTQDKSGWRLAADNDGLLAEVKVIDGVKLLNDTGGALGEWQTLVVPAQGGRRLLINLAAELFALNNSGAYAAQTAEFDLEVKGAGETNWTAATALLGDAALPAGLTNANGRLTASNDSDKIFRRTLELDIAGKNAGALEVRARRIGAKNTSPKVRDEMTLHSLVCFYSDAAYRQGQNIITLQAQAGKTLSGRVDKINYTAAARAEVWDGAAWQTEPAAQGAAMAAWETQEGFASIRRYYGLTQVTSNSYPSNLSPQNVYVSQGRIIFPDDDASLAIVHTSGIYFYSGSDKKMIFVVRGQRGSDTTQPWAFGLERHGHGLQPKSVGVYYRNDGLYFYDGIGNNATRIFSNTDPLYAQDKELFFVVSIELAQGQSNSICRVCAHDGQGNSSDVVTRVINFGNNASFDLFPILGYYSYGDQAAFAPWVWDGWLSDFTWADVVGDSLTDAQLQALTPNDIVAYTQTGAAAATSARVETQNPAAWFRAFALGERDANGRLLWGLGLERGQIDEEGLGAWFDFCDSFGLTCNAVIVGAETCESVLRKIAAAGRAQLSWRSGKLGVVAREPYQTPAAALTAADVVADSLFISFALREEHDGVEMNWREETERYIAKSLRVAEPGARFATRARRLQGWGITRRALALETAKLAAAEIKHKRSEFSFKLPATYLGLSAGDVVTLNHSDAGGVDTTHRLRVESVKFGEKSISITALPDPAALYTPLVGEGGAAVLANGEPVLLPGGLGLLKADNGGANFITLQDCEHIDLGNSMLLAA